MKCASNYKRAVNRKIYVKHNFFRLADAKTNERKVFPEGDERHSL